MAKKNGIIIALFSGFLWGLNGILLGKAFNLFPFSEKSFSQGIPSPEIYLFFPLLLATIHDGLSALWLFLNNLKLGQAKNLLLFLKTGEGFIIMLSALIGGPLAMSGNLLAINFAGAGTTLTISAIYPAIGASLAFIFLKQKLSNYAKVGILLSILGPIIIGLSPGDLSHDPQLYPQFSLGVCMALIPAFGWALEGVLSSKAMEKIPSSIAINLRQLTSFLTYGFILLPFLFGKTIFNPIIEMPFSSFTFLSLTALTGAISYLLWYHSMNLIGVGKAMALNITYALWATLMSFVLGDLKLTLSHLVGTSVIMMGSLLVILAKD